MKTFSFFLSFFTLTAAAKWHYMSDRGPEYWVADYPICGRASQSPININSLRAKYSKDLPAFTFSGYDAVPAGAAYKLKNNGHVAQVDLTADASDAFSISGGGLPRTYIADQFHFHWGSVNHTGSEHTLNGDSYPLEVHIVHHSSKYADLGTAADKDQGLAVLGFFFEIGKNNDAFDNIANELTKITHLDDETSVSPFQLFSMLPADLTSYWRYSGSLTTPPCYESVIWTVFQTPIVISHDQLGKFRDLIFEDANSNSTNAMVDTFRPVQPLGNRVVYSSVPNNDGDRFGIGGAASIVSVNASFLCAFLMAILLH